MEEILADILSQKEMEEIQAYIQEQAEKIAGTVLQDSINKYGMSNNTSIGVSADILANATARIASILATMTGQSDMITARIGEIVWSHINTFDRFVKDKMNVAMEKE